MSESSSSATPLLADAIRTLHAYQPQDRYQEALRAEYLAFLDDHPDGLWKSGPPEHLTASCVVLDAAFQNVLLTLHRRGRDWYQFGGHLEPGDVSVRSAAEREAHEESGLDALRVFPRPVQLDRHVLTGDFGRCREHLDVRYAGVAALKSAPRVSVESLDVRWWPLDQLPNAELTDLVAAALAVLRT